MVVETQTPIAVDTDPRWERMATAARASRCPRDQVGGFISAWYVPLPSLLPFHAAARRADRDDGPDLIGIGGTRGPGKSHAALAQAGLDDCQRAPGLKVLFLRKIMKSAAESLEDLVYKVFHYVPSTFTGSTGRVDFPNGSRILIGGFNNESDVDKYLGIEYDEIVVEEAPQLSENKINMIGGSLRSTRPGWKARMYVTGNPDGIGLQWFKERLVIPSREGREKYTYFLQANYRDNPFLGAEYIRYLEGLTGPLAAAWRDGDWDAFEGMAFPHWQAALHVIEPFEIPYGWVRWRAIDWGFAAPWCCLWIAKEPDTGRRYVYREAYQVQLTDSQQAQMVLDMTPPGEKIAFTYADPSMWTKRAHDNQIYTTADTYRNMGVPLTKADNDRMSGKRKVNQALGMLGDGKPGLQIFRNCVNLIRTLPALPLDKVHPEDVDTEAEDHAYDALRYGETNAPAIQAPKPRQEQRNPLAGRNF